MSLKKKIKDILPSSIISIIKRLYYARRLRYEAKLISAQPELHLKAVAKIRAKQGPINVVFFALMDSVWKCSEIYELMERDERFNPTILVCPVINYGYDNMIYHMEKCYNLFKSRGYNVIKSFNEETNQYVDVRKDLSPDIIFYTNPYEGLIDNRYFILNFTDILTCYVPYYIMELNNYDLKFNHLLCNLVWRYYIEFSYLIGFSQKYSRNKGNNVKYTGYPGIDRFIKTGESFKDQWKIKDRTIKRLIWAPHQTITEDPVITLSTFLDYYDFMLEMAEKYKNQIQIAFKPHPLLKNRLFEAWGEEKTLEYYAKWENLPNGIYNDGAYEDLFMTSDAIMHDCGSFICEYLYTNKPAMFLSNGKKLNKQFNDFANRCLNNYYIGYNKEDIESFIVNLIAGHDPLKKARKDFFEKELLPPNGKLAAQNIINDLIISLDLNH